MHSVLMPEITVPVQPTCAEVQSTPGGCLLALQVGRMGTSQCLTWRMGPW